MILTATLPPLASSGLLLTTVSDTGTAIINDVQPISPQISVGGNDYDLENCD